MSKGPNDEGLIFETSEDVEVLPFDALGLKDLQQRSSVPRCHRPISEWNRKDVRVLLGSLAEC